MQGCTRALVIVAVAAFVGLVSVDDAIARESVRVRTWDHSTYARIVLDWKRPVTFTATTEGRRITARFDRPFSADLQAVVRQLRPYVADARVSVDGRRAEFLLAGDFDVSSFASKRSVVLDIRRPFAIPDRSRSSETKAVGVRVGKHSKYIRLVFDWVKPVSYSIDESEKSVVVKFDRSARFNVAALRRRLGGGVGNPVVETTATATTITFAKNADRQVKHFKLGPKVVLDFVKGRAAPKKPVAKAKPKTASPKTEAAQAPAPESTPESKQPAKDPAPIAKTDDVAATKTDAKNAPDKVAPEKSVTTDDAPLSDATVTAKKDEPAADPAATRVSETPAAKDASAEPADASDLAASSDTTSASEPKNPIEPSGDAASSAPASAGVSGSEGDTATGESTAAVGTSTDPVDQTKDKEEVSLVFEWPEPVGAAVFVREPYVWIIFDRRAQLNLAALRTAGKSMIDQIEQMPLSEGTVVRLLAKDGVNPQVQREGSNWVVQFRRWPIAPQVKIALRVRPEAIDGAELELPVSEIGRIIKLDDPEVGDTLYVATLKAPGHGIASPRTYSEFRILASAQGVAVDPLGDDVTLKTAGNKGIVVGVPGGLHVSSISQSGDGSAAFLGPRIFNFGNWTKNKDPDFTKAKQSAMRTIVEVPKERRDDARLDLARYFFTRGFASEALGVLRTIEFSNEALSSQPEFRALIAATRVYMGRPHEARKDLLDPRLDEYQEISLWRGSMFLQTGELKKAAAQFRNGDPVLQSYPEPIRTTLALERVEASLADLDVGNASIWLNFLGKNVDQMKSSQAARLVYNQGVLARSSRDLDRAVEHWTKSKKSGDRWNVARSEFALVELGLQQESVTVEEAIQRLERLRYQWRGDDLELAVLKQLGSLHLNKGEFRKGLNTLRTAITYYPNNKKVQDIAQLMTAAFRELHLEGGADALPPLQALALYDDFRELTPAGNEGDLMIQKLADRLVSVDLLDRAADLLAHQVRFRLKGEERARVGAKLAVIRLLDRNPKGALSALRGSFQPNLSTDLEDDRRRIRAKATLELGRYEEAIALLAGDVSREADLLRANIYWSTRNYSEAAKVLQRLAGDPLAEGGYPENQASFILSWAVALRLKRDEAGIIMLRDLYGPGMARSKLADAFGFISSPTGRAAKNIDDITRKMAESDTFDAFLKNYRDRLIAPSKMTNAKKAAPGAAAQGETKPDAQSDDQRAGTAAPNAIPQPPPPPSG
jgi:tetratricopeptide (TPR) repeat protein